MEGEGHTRYLQAQSGERISRNVSPVRSHFSSESELEEEDNISLERRSQSLFRQPIASGHSLEFSAIDIDAMHADDAIEAGEGDLFRNDYAPSTRHTSSRNFDSAESTSSRRRGSRSSSGITAASKDGAGSAKEHFPQRYRFPSRQSSYQPLASTSHLALPLHEKPPPPNQDLDEDIDMPPIAVEPRIPDRDLAENTKAVPFREDGGETGTSEEDRPHGGLAHGPKRDAAHKMTVTMKSPTSTDFREVSPGRFHTRDDSDPHSDTGYRSGLSTPGGSAGEPSDDDYDWSGEEDLADQHAKFNEQMGQGQKQRTWGIKRIFNLLFSTLIGSTVLSGLLITPALIVHFFWYKVDPTEKRWYIDKNIQAWLFWVASNITISWFLAMMIDVVPLFVQYFLIATWGHVSEAVKTRLEMYGSVKDTAKPAFYAASCLASWVIIFTHIYHLHSQDSEVESAASYTDRLYQVILFFFFFTLIICIQKMLSHYIAWNFHQTAYKDRIDEVQSSLAVIEKLQKYRPKAHKRTGTGSRTPGGGFFLGGQPLSERDHYRKLNSALRSVATNPSRLSKSMVPEPETDEEYGETTLVGVGKKKKRHVWLDFGTKQTTPSDEFLKDFHNSKEKTSPVDLKTDDEMEEIPLVSVRPPSIPPPVARPGTPARLSPSSPPHHRKTPSAVSFSSTRRGSLDRGERPVRPPHTRTSTGLSDVDAKVKQAANVIKKAVLHDARNLQGRHEDLLAWNVNSTLEAKRLAKSIFRRLKDGRRKFLVASDFYPAFPTKDEALAAFRLFDKDNNGDLSRAEIKIKLVKTYQERRFLSRSLKDVGEALGTLDRILLIFACIIIFFISLSIFGVEVGSSLTSMYSIGIAASFIFKSSASRAFDAIMFLFVTHPYDTGDRVFIGEENLVVKKVGLFATVFSRSDGTETYYFNSQLFTKFITNARRSDKTTENLTLQVAWKTPLTKLDALENYLNQWLSTEENRWFQPTTGVSLQNIVYQRYLTLTIGIPHNGNWQDWGLHNTRRTAFHAAVQYYSRQLGITGFEAPMPIVFNETEALSASQSDRLAQDGQTTLAPPSTPFSGDEPTPEEEDPQQKDDDLAAAQKVKSSLGFLPPLDYRSKNMARARKSRRSRKHNLGAMNAEC